MSTYITYIGNIQNDYYLLVHSPICIIVNRTLHSCPNQITESPYYYVYIIDKDRSSLYYKLQITSGKKNKYYVPNYLIIYYINIIYTQYMTYYKYIPWDLKPIKLYVDLHIISMHVFILYIGAVKKNENRLELFYWN